MKHLTVMLLLLVLVLGGLWLVWEWGFCRFYVAPDTMAIIIAKDGEPLPSGQILANEKQKGVREQVLGEGRHFLNPYFFEHKLMPVTVIPAGKVGIVTAKVGKDLPPGEFLAETGQKGIWKRVLGPGKYRLNPVGYQIDVMDAISIPIGYAGVVTSLAGDKAPEGQFAGPNQKGIRSDILQPGLYYANPKQFKIDVLEVGLNQVSLLGKTGGAVITKGQIASQNETMNRLQFKVLESQMQQRNDYLAQNADIQMAQPQQAAPAESEKADSSFQLWSRSATGRNAAAKRAPANAPQQAPGKPARPNEPNPAASPTFVLNQFVEFPSRDGFEISLDMTVEFELLPTQLATLFRNYGDLPAVVDKIIMPQILSISRMKGSAYRATDFIVGEGREKFQNDLTLTLKKSLEEKNITIHNALIRHVNVPSQILDPIQQAGVAIEQDLTNKEKQNTARKQAELNTEQSLIEQRGAQVAQETAKLKAEIRAEQDKLVAEIKAETLKQVAVVDQQTAGLRAEKVKTLGKAQAESVQMVEGERATGFQMKVKALGDAQAYNLVELARSLNPLVNITILHAGEGTLWTDLERASLGDLGGAKLLSKPAPEK